MKFEISYNIKNRATKTKLNVSVEFQIILAQSTWGHLSAQPQMGCICAKPHQENQSQTVSTYKKIRKNYELRPLLKNSHLTNFRYFLVY